MLVRVFSLISCKITDRSTTDGRLGSEQTASSAVYRKVAEVGCYLHRLLRADPVDLTVINADKVVKSS